METAKKTSIDMIACKKSRNLSLYFSFSSAVRVIDPSITHNPLGVANPYLTCKIKFDVYFNNLVNLNKTGDGLMPYLYNLAALVSERVCKREKEARDGTDEDEEAGEPATGDGWTLTLMG